MPLDTAFAELHTHEAVEGFARQLLKHGGWVVVDRRIQNAQTGSGVLNIAKRDPYTAELSGHTLVHYGCPEHRELFGNRLRLILDRLDKLPARKR